MSQPDPETLRSPHRSQAFLLLYTLAYGGGVIAYVPLLSLMLPLKVELMAPDGKVALLSLITLTGAVVASVANILIGVLSDRTVGGPHGRRPWIVGGLVATLASFVLLHLSTTPMMLVAAVAVFQVALNVMLAPLIAIAADEAPDDQKGLVGGLFGAAYPLGAVAGVAVTATGLAEAGQFAVVGALLLASVLPFLCLQWRRGALIGASDQAPVAKARGRRNLALVWVSRLMIQMAGSILFAYFLFYFETVDHGGLEIAPRALAGKISWLSGAAAVVGVPLAIVIGRASDATGLRKPFLVAMAGVITIGLLILALLPQWRPAALGYVLFSVGAASFLALQNAYAMQLLPSPNHRGRDLGILNLTNTIPAVAAPSLAYAVVTAGGFQPLLLMLAGLSALAGGLMLMVRDEAGTQEPEPYRSATGA